MWKRNKGTLQEQMQRTGNWFFKWRSYLPILCTGLILLALRNFKFPYGSHKLDQMWELLCFAISLAGLIIRIITVGFVPKGTSGRNTKTLKASTLNTTGMYSLLRNPLYFGNSIIWLGVSLFARLWWLTAILLLIFWLYYERIIMAEEEFLIQRFGQQFIDWAQRVPAFFPDFRNWKKPQLAFSWKSVLKRENSTLFIIILMFFGMEEISSLISTGCFEADFMWFSFFIIGFLLYSILLILKKNTTLLDVPGR
jgi:protein-S-isoprenylcysteine O-methyltransferase Ste14